MNQQPAVVPCSRCGFSNWQGAPCARCGAPPGGGPGGNPNMKPIPGMVPNAGAGMANPGMMNPAAMLAGGLAGNLRKPGGNKALAYGGIFGVIVLIVGGGFAATFLKGMIFREPGTASTKEFGIDASKATPEQIVAASEKLAKQWRNDAQLRAFTVNGLKTDGTVDLAAGGTAEVEFYSPSRVQAFTAKGREDAVKKFSFTETRIRFKDRWDAKKAWKSPAPMPGPRCPVANVGKALAASGAKPDAKGILAVHPRFGANYHVNMGSLNKWYSLSDCKEVFSAPGGSATDDE